MAQATIPALSLALSECLPELPASLHTKRVQKAFELASSLSRFEQHWTGMSRLRHALGVLQVLLPFEPDEDTVIACLLQHVLRGRRFALTDLEQQFGAKVRTLVTGIHLLSHVSMQERAHGIEDLRLMMLSVSDDPRVVLIMLCERCFVLEHLQAIVPDVQRELCHEVLNLFAPVAGRLGIHALKQRLERLAFPVVYPADSERIAEQLNFLHVKFQPFLDSTAVLLRSVLAERGIAATIEGREKQSYSIFLKMKSKSVTQIDSIPDLFALRVIVDSMEQCYQALGIVHQLGRPVPNRFKDYIAFPKPNGYQSLHTTVARLPGVPEGVFLEVQVRTQAMHREAEYGIAAHWSYKEGGSTLRAAHRAQLLSVLASQQALEGGENDSTLLADHIFVLTPKGGIVELPEGATPLDFAFAIHTDIGLSFRAAKVNGSIVSLDYELQNGDMVEILRQPHPRPSPEWMSLLRSSAARSRLKHYLYGLDRERYIDRGRELVNEEFAKHHLPPLNSDLLRLRYYDGWVLSTEEREDMLMKIGQGAEKAASALAHFDDVAEHFRVEPVSAKKTVPRLQRKDALIELEGSVRMPTRFAKCCVPQEGTRDGLIGITTRLGTVMVHRDGCRMVRSANPERRIGVKWRKLS